MTNMDERKDDKASVESWEDVESFVMTYPSDTGEEISCNVSVQIGKSDNGNWYVRTKDDLGSGDHADAENFYSRGGALAAAKRFVDEHS